jgi:adenosylcobinamide-phosphate synthase
MSAGTLAAAMLLALAIDLLWGEPHARWHPVVWIGRYLGWAGRFCAPEASQPLNASAVAPDLPAFWRGALAWCVGATVCVVLAYGISAGASVLPDAVSAGVLACALKPLLAWRMLRDEVRAVEVALSQSLAAGRARLAHLVSRDVSALRAGEVRESAIESLAENLNDSVIAPLFWFALLGLPGAALYRFANTADAMWGYRGVRQGSGQEGSRLRVWEWAGKWAARVDDVLSWLPARITALLLSIAAFRWPHGLLREAVRTPSPNSGWPMAAMALLLGVRLGKPGAYVLNAPGRVPDAADAVLAERVAGRALALVAVGAVSVMAVTLLAMP